MVDNWEQGLVIPRDISFEDVSGQGFRVKKFLELIIYDEQEYLKEPPPKNKPWAILFVESPFFNKLGKQADKVKVLEVLSPIDYANFVELYENRGVNEEEEEVIVDYRPPEKTIRKKWKHKSCPCLHISIMPKGSLDKIYRFYSNDLSRIPHSGKEIREFLKCIRTMAECDPIEGWIEFE
ncbi:hypothetical protein ACFLXO_05340 [Chloroflexota bacterium]